MARLPLVIYPDVILKTRCDDITEINGELVEFAQDMVETMYVSHGIGLAAPQVARNIRMMTIDVEEESGGQGLLTLVNPVILESHGRTTYQEGCLSFPGMSVEVRRKDQVHLQAYGLDGEEILLEADGLLSICIQHEMDHLNGITFVDRLNPVRRKLVLRPYLADLDREQDDQDEDRIRKLHGDPSP
ncbi:MAG: peptide deformylase [Myxococcota bacterium]|nr:peptide deformylase [Myxococcota bacterium]